MLSSKKMACLLNVIVNSNGEIWFLVQSGWRLCDGRSRGVIPFNLKSLVTIPAKRLNPSVEIEGGEHVLVMQFMSAIAVFELMSPVTDLACSHDAIVSALDMAFHGF